jgi:DNA modification methylase
MTLGTILVGDCRRRLRELPDRSVHAVVTSPPYFGLRNYGSVPHQIGLERELDCFGWVPGHRRCGRCYLCHLLEVFGEVQRVLRDDGTVWLNIGDGYVSRGVPSRQSALKACADAWSPRGRPRARHRHADSSLMRPMQPRSRPTGLKEKDLTLVPQRLALALQAQGWHIRRDVVWEKPNVVPESCRDRPTGCHEYVWLLSKARRYFYDGEAIREWATGNSHPRGSGVNPKAALINQNLRARARTRQNASWSAAVQGVVATRNARSVWTIVTEPYLGAHYATFPRALARKCLLASTSAGGCCATCGAPRRRIVRLAHPLRAWQRASGSSVDGQYGGGARKAYAPAGAQDPSAVKARILAGMRERVTVGWRRTCACRTTAVVPATVLDCFGGAGTTGVVAVETGRRFLLVDVNRAYARQAVRRIEAAALLGEVEVA